MAIRNDHTEWTADELGLLATLAASGCSAEVTAAELNAQCHNGKQVRTPASVGIQRSKLGLKVVRPTRPPVYAAPVASRIHVPERDASDPLEWLEKVRPIAVTPPSLPRASVQPVDGMTVVGGDFHFGTASEQAMSVFIETCRQLQPSRVILNGDLPDLLAVSKYPKDVRKRFTWTLQDEAAQMHTFLRELEAAVPRTTQIVETEANHSGNGTASRWWRYLSEHIGPLMTLPGAEERMSYQSWWYPEWSRLQLVESVVVADDLLVLHGDIVRKHAGYSARATMEKWWHSTMNSHTHRMGGGFQSVPALPHREGGQTRFYEIGCLCNLEPSYASAPNWTNGFAVIREDGEDYNVELVPVIKGRAVVNALGATVRAA